MTAPAQKLPVNPEGAEGQESLLKMIRLSSTTPEVLKEAHAILEAIPETLVQRMIALGIQHLREHLELPKIQNNLAHVEDQLLRPVIEDGDDLEAWFGVNPLRLRLLVVLHDLGKVDIPEPMLGALQRLFPHDFVGREILTHEFASMHWIEQLGQQLTLDPTEIVALQRLIANHNFGPNLCAPKYKALRAHWWPSNFRQKIMPKLKELGVDLDTLYKKSEDGQHQYNHCEDEVYATLLSAYDRALANRYNEYGLETWQKFAQQDYTAWQAAAEKDPSLPSCFHAKGITEKMEQAANWAEIEVRTMWAILNERHILNARRREFALDKFPPYQRQIEGMTRLKQAIQKVKAVNEATEEGSLKYETSTGELFRVEEGHAEKSKLFWWNETTKAWELVAKDRSPIKLFFEMLKSDF